MTDFRVDFDESDMTITFTDDTGAGENKVVVVYPDGIEQDFGKILTTANSWTLQIPARTDIFGSLMQGDYTFTLTRYNVGNPTPTGTQTDVFTLSYADIPIVVTEVFDVFTPTLGLTDGTDYGRNGWTLGGQSRLWEVVNGTHEWTSLQSVVTLTDGGFYTGAYTWDLRANVGYTNENGYVTLTTHQTVSGSETITKPLMIPEIAALFNCLYAKIIAGPCCPEDSTYDEMLADYNRAVTMSHHFILNGQAGITGTSQSNLLSGTGTKCNPGILGLLARWGCSDATIEETLLSAYDWCLCDTGGGGGVTADRDEYLAGTGCWISSDAIATGEKFTFAMASGVGTFTQNLAGSRIFSGTVRGTSAEATHTSNLATDSFKLVIPVHGANANLGYATALWAAIQVWGAPAAAPTPTAPWVMDEGAVQKRIVDIGSNAISFVFAGIGATYGNGWAVTWACP